MASKLAISAVAAAMMVASVSAFAPLLSVTGMHLRPALASQHRNRLVQAPSLRNSQPLSQLRMTSDENPGAPTIDRAEKLASARKLADEARKALVEAELAEIKAATLRGKDKATKLDIRSEYRTKELLDKIAQITYKSWYSSFAGTADKPDPLGLTTSAIEDTEDQRTERARAVFNRLDTDGSGGICRQEMEQGMQGMGLDVSHELIESLFMEADTNNDSVICFEEFNTVMQSLRAGEEARLLKEEIDARDAKQKIKLEAKKLTFSEVYAVLQDVQLVGMANETGPALNVLKAEQKLNLWNSLTWQYKEVSAEKMNTLTGMEKADKQLGLLPDEQTVQRFRIQQFITISSILCLLFGGALPDPVRDLAIKWGYIGLAYNLITPFFARQINQYFLDKALATSPNADDRWRCRQVGRLFAAYMCGIPVESVDYSTPNRPVVEIYSKCDGGVNFDLMRNATNGIQALQDFGLTPKQVQAQAIVQMTGLMNEYVKYGEATFGFEFFRALDSQISLSQSFVDPFARQYLSRFGVMKGFEIILANKDVLEKMKEGMEKGADIATLIAILESNELPQQL